MSALWTWKKGKYSVPMDVNLCATEYGNRCWCWHPKPGSHCDERIYMIPGCTLLNQSIIITKYRLPPFQNALDGDVFHGQLRVNHLTRSADLSIFARCQTKQLHIDLDDNDALYYAIPKLVNSNLFYCGSPRRNVRAQLYDHVVEFQYSFLITRRVSWQPIFLNLMNHLFRPWQPLDQYPPLHNC